MWSYSISYSNLSQINTNIGTNCPAQLKYFFNLSSLFRSMHQNSLHDFNCASKYESMSTAGFDSYNIDCPTSQLAVIWEQDEGKLAT